MSTANIEGFLERVKTDDALRSKVAEIDRSDDAATATALATISTEAGFSCSPEEFLELLRAKQELADEDLEPVAGGIDRPWSTVNGSLKSLWRDFGKLTGWWG